MADQPDHPLLQVRGMGKTFPGVRALDDVDLTLHAGEVVAVVGENGAGKSTLMKILAGVESPDSGSIMIDGREVIQRSVQDAIKSGVVLIHQELNLAGNLDAAANICLGREPGRLGFIDRAAVRKRAKRALERIAPDTDPGTRVEDLPVGRRQLVEIAKALSYNARVLIMDEPTSSLSTGETQRLFAVIRELRSQGVGILYISHRLAEVDAVADRVVVLRDGKRVGDLDRTEISHDAIVNLMIGRELERFPKRSGPKRREQALEVRGLTTEAHPDEQINFRVEKGEIVGIAGLVGAGRTELLEAIFGVTPALKGDVVVRGETIRARSVADAARHGLALVPEDRQLHGLIGEFSIRGNVSLPSLAEKQRAGFVNRAAECSIASQTVSRLNIKTDSDRREAQTLSGGNQQKVVLGKWLPSAPSILLLDEPTRGVDIGARAEIYRIIESLADDGTAILFVSSDMEEIVGLAQRLLVMKDGRITGELTADQIEEEAIMRLATAEEVAA